MPIESYHSDLHTASLTGAKCYCSCMQVYTLPHIRVLHFNVWECVNPIISLIKMIIFIITCT